MSNAREKWHANITLLVYTILSQQVNESFDLKEGIKGWYKKEGDKTGKDGCMLLW